MAGRVKKPCPGSKGATVYRGESDDATDVYQDSFFYLIMK